MVDKVKTFEKITKDLFKQLDLKVGIEIKQNGDLVSIQLDNDEPGILIGYHGQTLAALQLIIALMAFKKLGEWTKTLVNIDDYRQKRQESLERMAEMVCQKVIASGESQDLPPMPPLERRIIHLTLAENDRIETVSEGEGKERHVVVKLKS